MNKIIFVGAVELSQAAYEELLAQGIKPDLLVTLFPEYSRRHSDFVDLTKIDPSVPYLLVNDINEHVEALAKQQPDYILVWGWSQLIKKPLIQLPRIGCVGMHPSPLPRNRGRAVIPWTILTHQWETGLTFFYIDEGVDSGPIIAQRKFMVAPDETARTLYDKTKEAARELVRQMAPKLKEGVLDARAQDHSRASYFAKRTPADGLIDWSRDANEINLLIRASTGPYPGAFTYMGAAKVIIWRATVISASYTGVPGQIVATEKDGTCVVQCGQGHLQIQAIPCMKLHSRFSNSRGSA